MIVSRERLLKVLAIASVGLTKREILEQSNAYVFTEDSLVTFNGEVLTRTANPLRTAEETITGAVPADKLMSLLSKLPDDEVEVSVKGEEFRIKGGKRRAAGITRGVEIHLPYADVPLPKKWGKVPEKLMGVLLQAARVCGSDETKPRTTEVHVAEDRVEACDNTRLFRYTMKTGFAKAVLIPAVSVEAIAGLVVRKVSAGSGWVHFKTRGNHTVSVRTSIGEYPDITKHLILHKPTKVTLPANLSDILSRADVMQESGVDASVSVRIENNTLTLTSKDEEGWFKETKKVDYSGKPLRFEVHPKFLEEVVSKKKTVTVGGDRMKLKSKEAVFVICLERTEE